VIDIGERPADRIRIGWPDEARDFPAVLEEHEGRPELHAEGAAEPTSARIGDLDMADTGVIGERIVNDGLGAAAMTAPRAAEFQERGAGEGVDFGSRRLGGRIVVGRGHC
jgi:hypothetical protein